MIGRSEEKLRPKSLFLRRLIARYVIWVEIAGYALVLSLVVGLIFAARIEAEKEYLAVPGEARLKVEVIQATQSAEVTSVMGKDASVEPTKSSVVQLEQSPARVASASLVKGLQQQKEFAQKENQTAVVANIDKMIADARQSNTEATLPESKSASISGKWYPTVQVGDIVTSGQVLGVIISPRDTQIEIDTKDSAVTQNGKKLKEDQPTTITVPVGGAPVALLGKMTQGGRKDPKIAVTEIPSAEVEKIVAYYQKNPSGDRAFAKSSANVLVGIKTWASLIWK